MTRNIVSRILYVLHSAFSYFECVSGVYYASSVLHEDIQCYVQDAESACCQRDVFHNGLYQVPLS